MPSDSKEFHELTKKDAQRQLENELNNLLQTAQSDVRPLHRIQMDSFAALYARFLQEEGPSVNWDNIQKLPDDAVKQYASLKAPHSSDSIRQMLDKLVVIKLNGGLGTSMGCHGPKSVIPVRSDLTFLDLTVQQIEVCKSERFTKMLSIL